MKIIETENPCDYCKHQNDKTIHTIESPDGNTVLRRTICGFCYDCDNFKGKKLIEEDAIK